MNPAAFKEQKENDLVEFWKRIPYAEQIEIDLAIDKGNKAEAANRDMCSVKKVDRWTAKKLVENRQKELKKMI